MRTVGLTGGIGMGKSTTAAVFRRAGVPVFDADGVVRALQAPGGAALRAIGKAFPGTVRSEASGRVLDRAALRAAVLGGDPAALARLERILHPLVRRAERQFLARARRDRARLAVLDLPLLLETAGERRPGACHLDTLLLVSAPPDVQRARVRRRGTLDPAQLAAVLARQMPDAEKRRRVRLHPHGHLVRTGLSRHHAWRAVRRLITCLRDPGPR